MKSSFSRRKDGAQRKGAGSREADVAGGMDAKVHPLDIFFRQVVGQDNTIAQCDIFLLFVVSFMVGHMDR